MELLRPTKNVASEITLYSFQGYLFYHAMSGHSKAAFFSDSILHTNNKIDPSASCSTFRVNAHFMLFFPLREIKPKKAVLDTCSHTSQSISLKKNSDLRQPVGYRSSL